MRIVIGDPDVPAVRSYNRTAKRKAKAQSPPGVAYDAAGIEEHFKQLWLDIIRYAGPLSATETITSASLRVAENSNIGILRVYFTALSIRFNST
jgi:hypothetical protein